MRKIEKGERGISESERAHVENGKKPRLKREHTGLENPAPPFSVLQGLEQNPQIGNPDLCPVVPFLNASQSLLTTRQQL